jgi:pyrroloquinoline quinone (PQQ) biosynthesis protein C
MTKTGAVRDTDDTGNRRGDIMAIRERRKLSLLAERQFTIGEGPMPQTWDFAADLPSALTSSGTKWRGGPQRSIREPDVRTRSSDSAAAFVADLSALALTHRAVPHPYLQAIENGRLPDMRWALADFARQYYGYSRRFPCYLAAIIPRLENRNHRQALRDNMTEEAGSYTEDELRELDKLGVAREWYAGISHSALFARFAAALGVDLAAQRESDRVTSWREQFLAIMTQGTAAEAVGALGIGTENIVRAIYRPFIRALDRLGDLPPRDTVFFTLHVAVDDHHQATLQSIAADLAATANGRRQVREGMLKALNLRAAFWDWLHARAIDPAQAEGAL